jgi:hypothetical protein
LQVCVPPVTPGNVILPYPYPNDISISGTLTFNNLNDLKTVSDQYYNISSFLQPSIYDLNLFSPGIASQIIPLSDINLATLDNRNWLWGNNSESPYKFSISGLVPSTHIKSTGNAVLRNYYNTYLSGGYQELFSKWTTNSYNHLSSLVYGVPNDHFPWTSNTTNRLHIDFDNAMPKLLFGLEPNKFGFYTRMFENSWPLFNIFNSNDIGYVINDIAGLKQKKLS